MSATIFQKLLRFKTGAILLLVSLAILLSESASNMAARAELLGSTVTTDKLLSGVDASL